MLKCVFLLVSFIFTITSYTQFGWVQYQTSADSLNSFDFFDANTGMAVGNSGVFLKTINGGVNWFIPNSRTLSTNILEVKLLSALTCLLVTSDSILRSTDGGYSLNPVYSHFYAKYSSMCFVNNLTGYLIFANKILKTTNGGINWQEIAWSSFSFYDIALVNTQTFYTSGFWEFNVQGNEFVLGDIIKSTNQGTSWSTVYQEPGDTKSHPLYFFDDNNGLWYDYAFAKTTNGGANWFPIDIGTSETINKIFFINHYKGWLAGNNGKIVSTTNEGSTWSIQQSGVTSNILNIKFIDQYTGWAVTSTGTMLKTTSGGFPRGIIKISDEIAENFSLSQNYPNPFNPYTKITFIVPNERIVKLELYDVLGKRIKVLIDGNFSPGKYLYNFFEIDIPSGIYYYRLISNNFSQTKKMVLIK